MVLDSASNHSNCHETRNTRLNTYVPYLNPIKYVGYKSCVKYLHNKFKSFDALKDQLGMTL